MVYSRIGHRVNRVILRNSNSSPFISGDLFKQNADIQVTEKSLGKAKILLSDVSAARVIFCQSHLLHKFLSEYGDHVQARVLICGNSDFDFDFPPANIPKSIQLCLLQNLNFESEFFRVLPIGLENLSLATNGFTKYYLNPINPSIRLNRVLAGPFSATHPAREKLIDEIGRNNSFHLLTERLSPSEYQIMLGKYKYVLCPRGNGIDTHRFWETLYKGNLPVISESIWSSHINRLNIPFHLYSAIGGVIASTQLENDNTLNPASIEALWWPYWKNLINSFL